MSLIEDLFPNVIVIGQRSVILCIIFVSQDYWWYFEWKYFDSTHNTLRMYVNISLKNNDLIYQEISRLLVYYVKHGQNMIYAFCMPVLVLLNILSENAFYFRVLLAAWTMRDTASPGELWVPLNSVWKQLANTLWTGKHDCILSLTGKHDCILSLTGKHDCILSLTGKLDCILSLTESESCVCHGKRNCL